MEVPLEILEELKCVNCDSYLSRGPVYLQHNNGMGLCAQCFVPESAATRNKQYESLAKLLKFPCKNREFGCTLTVPFIDDTDDNPHEEECNYRQYMCPLLGPNDCEWIGPRNEMLQHCQNQHPNQVVGNPVSLTHDVSRSYIETYLMTAFELLFLLQTKVCIDTGKIFHGVSFFGESTKAKEFGFTVEMKRKKVCLSQFGYVSSRDALTNVTWSINNLLEVIDDFSDAIFTIVISKLINDTTCCAKCEKNLLTFIYREQNGWWCEDCIPNKRQCENQSKGCTYTDFNFKSWKHEWYFCPFAKFCFICNQNIVESLDSHYTSVHQNVIFPMGTVWRATKTDQNWEYCLIESAAGTAVCEYWMSDLLFQIDVFIPVLGESLSKFRCSIQIALPETNISRIFTPDLSPYTDWEDWHVGIIKNEFPWTSEGLNISIDITTV